MFFFIPYSLYYFFTFFKFPPPTLQLPLTSQNDRKYQQIMWIECERLTEFSHAEQYFTGVVRQNYIKTLLNHFAFSYSIIRDIDFDHAVRQSCIDLNSSRIVPVDRDRSLIYPSNTFSVVQDPNVHGPNQIVINQTFDINTKIDINPKTIAQNFGHCFDW